FNFVEELLPKEINAFDREFIKDVERKVKEKLEREIKDTVEYVQEEYGADIFHFNLAMMRYEPKVWEEIEEEWHDIFPTVNVDINADIDIRLVGLIK
ncbi:MAG: hypothetical protein JJT76_07710, partial [Clostridiaceae bacterium]|nr:hypothetical protein [Clostridiaceae bacterium]